MKQNKEKLAFLSELIEMANSDNELKKVEYDFILDVSKELRIEEAAVKELIANASIKQPHKSIEDRIRQLHRLIVLMNIDGQQHPLEVQKLQMIGLRMGLKPSMVLCVIKAVNENPGKVLSVENLWDFVKETS